MHSEHFASRYTPTSPLSPKISASHRPLSPQANRRVPHGRHASRNMRMDLPRYHPANFNQHEPAASPSSTVQSPAVTLNRVNQPIQLESPHLMREKHREFIERARLSSKIAASPMTNKPDAPRLDPLGSPNGAVTPLALEEADDYFQVVGAGKHSPATSPGARSVRSDSSSGKEDGSVKKSRKGDIYH